MIYNGSLAEQYIIIASRYRVIYNWFVYIHYIISFIRYSKLEILRHMYFGIII